MSDAIFNLDAEVRTDLGKGASRRLRREDKVPAILYGAGKDPVSLTLAHNKVIQAQEFEAFYSHVLTLDIAGEKVDALVKDMQRHPYKPKVTHIDFLRVDKNKEVTTNIPLHFINEDKAESIKTEGGHAEHHMNDVEVTCLPGVLPEFIEVNLEPVGLGETVHLSDLVLPEGVVLVELSKGESHDLAVATIKTAKGPSADEEESEAGDSEEAAPEE
ncbi:50S ribosomal protein L25/general stress protein Ctc [Aliiglaciecola sp. SL4]|uniref:50S ribosomal protein L25/general stress protein Ctc n=1 Tax=Aliiglaciecola sp. SL4 TaxID=3239806 RepID=UPI00355BD8CC